MLRWYLTELFDLLLVSSFGFFLRCCLLVSFFGVFFRFFPSVFSSGFFSALPTVFFSGIFFRSFFLVFFSGFFFDVRKYPREQECECGPRPGHMQGQGRGGYNGSSGV